MDRLLQTFDTPFTDKTGATYDVHVWTRDRPADTWQAWLVFTRRSDGRTFTTDVETTQPSSDAVQYWATGLETTYLDGAFARAQEDPDKQKRAEVKETTAPRG